MTSVAFAKLLIVLGVVTVIISFVYSVANMAGLLDKKKPTRSGIRIAGINDDFDNFNSGFRRHGIAMLVFVFGGVLAFSGLYIGGIDIIKETLSQFGIVF